MFEKEYRISDEHIDFQNVVDDLYFAFYMEWCRHSFMSEVVGVDVEEEAKNGDMYVVLESNIKFKKPLLQGQHVKVTCEMYAMKYLTRFSFHQKIMVNDKVHAEGDFIATFLPKNGRPHIPEIISAYLK